MKMKSHLNNRKLWAIIPAAGSGSRFSKTELKQYQLIQNKTVLEHTVNRLMQLPLAGCVLAIGEQDDVAQTLAFEQKDKIHFCLGGAERVNSVLNALLYLTEIAEPEDVVLVHDAARPCVTLDCLNQLLNVVKQTESSAILAVPVRDTLKRVAKNHEIDKTVSREQLWQAQTPQMSTIAQLKQAIEHALKNQCVITDEASALEFIGQTVQVVQGRSDNIKITYPDDLELARLILMAQQ
ncbi:MULTISPECIES: 2-C-methyl-D-erythritol 4-phosphate cytidylyltransferase [unclassified Acinetobacter]|uniref:2-C-methyl-D-erythritol 4-phosphate cytidylyltransferase n=1 Tax=unclassified Acinetobacter TaxID=196816 RepID=UPI0025776F0F|nr:MULTISPECIES: 2-C-methyl-D-erythritol 4-phosphate cytidylyltransferase [unclassified Acinetobacter]MDM1764738.1 2-C-methyl-D-erythritol 4-phosphate cytidylyltransferase [Acinetobacter sp. 226-1]MDM1769492.1 2-C-methyl-D-erythritol 4-phosphate cytidylyltransferase [Acinetobacter sp. 226-4]